MEIKKYTEVTGSSCAGKTTFFKNMSYYITGGYVSWSVFPSFIFRFFFLVLGFFYLLLSPAKFFWIIRHASWVQISLVHKVSALKNAIEKFGCYFVFRQRPVLVDEGVSHIPFIYQLTTENIVEFLSIFEKELRDISIVMLNSPKEQELISRLIARGHKKVACRDSAIKFACMNINISNCYAKYLKEQEKINVRTV